VETTGDARAGNDAEQAGVFVKAFPDVGVEIYAETPSVHIAPRNE
jgi:hypothetical protein